MKSKLPRRLIFHLIVATLVASAILQTPTGASNSNPMIHQAGGGIVDGANKPIKLKGVNLEGWLQWEGLFFGVSMLTSGTEVRERVSSLVGADGEEKFEREIYDNFITEADIAKIAELGFNVVRLPISAKLLVDPQQPDGYKQAGWKLIDSALDWCQKYRVYAIIDLHSAPGGQSRLATCERAKGEPILWTSEENKKRTVELWKAIAARYRSRQIVAGYDLLNEPLPPDSAQLLRLYQRIIDSIRSVDPDHMVILEGMKMAGDFSLFDRPLCENQMYSIHMYTWFGDDRLKKLAKYKALADSQHVPLWIGEYGANTYEMIDSTTAMFDDMPEIVGWCYWTWKKAPTKYPGLSTISVPAVWKPIAKWISFPLGKKPGRVETTQGLEALVPATRLDKTPIDMRMVQILSKGHASP